MLQGHHELLESYEKKLLTSDETTKKSYLVNSHKWELKKKGFRFWIP